MNVIAVSRWTLPVLGAWLVIGACAAAAGDRDDRGPRHGYDRGHPPVVDSYPRGGAYAGLPEIQVFADPASEHWPANYLPDSHRLDGYDGRTDRITDCRGASGRTLSTREQPCAQGQTPAENARSWSTSPD